jgi:tetratricopeptide (TPR) repeat protein
VLAVLALFPRGARAQDSVEDLVRPSVVQIRNDECYGTGMFLDGRGLILTNAHVACSPLPFRVLALVTLDGVTKPVTFRKVDLLGFHPDYDLALLRIDPEELGAAIKPVSIAPAPPPRGERVWALGFPSDHDRGKAEVATWGEMRSSNEDFYGLPYLAVDISITHGNSGGPLCNEKGQVVGVVTAAEPHGALAVPISVFRPEKFGPLKARRPNREMTTRYLGMADALMKKEGKPIPPVKAIYYYETALLWDNGNPDLYSKVGQINLAAERFPVAVAYLTRSLQMGPWPVRADAYRNLGTALAGLHKDNEAVAVWREGLDKYPLDNAELWGALAAALERERRPLEGAVAARVALKTSVERPTAVNEVYRRCRSALSPAQQEQLGELESGLDVRLERMRAASEEAKRAGRVFLNADAEQVIATMSGVQQVAAPEKIRIETPKVEPERIPESEIDARFIRGRMTVVKELMRTGKLDQAAEILEDLVRTFPTHPETDAARLALKVLRRN